MTSGILYLYPSVFLTVKWHIEMFVWADSSIGDFEG